MYRYTLQLVSWSEHDDNVASYFDQMSFKSMTLRTLLFLYDCVGSRLCVYLWTCIYLSTIIHYRFIMLDDKKIIKHRLLNGRKRLDGGKNTLHFHAEFRSNFKRPCSYKIHQTKRLYLLRSEDSNHLFLSKENERRRCWCPKFLNT